VRQKTVAISAAAVFVGLVAFSFVLHPLPSEKSAQPATPVSVPLVSEVEPESPVDTRSTNLRLYEEAAEPIDHKIGNAGAVVQCNLQSAEWYKQVVEALEEYRAGPVVGVLKQRLTAVESSAADAFDSRTANQAAEFALGSGCGTLGAMPFVHSYSAFAP